VEGTAIDAVSQFTISRHRRRPRSPMVDVEIAMELGLGESGPLEHIFQQLTCSQLTASELRPCLQDREVGVTHR
jgi:hypothetical protein